MSDIPPSSNDPSKISVPFMMENGLGGPQLIIQEPIGLEIRAPNPTDGQLPDNNPYPGPGPLEDAPNRDDDKDVEPVVEPETPAALGAENNQTTPAVAENEREEDDDDHGPGEEGG